MSYGDVSGGAPGRGRSRRKGPGAETAAVSHGVAGVSREGRDSKVRSGVEMGGRAGLTLQEALGGARPAGWGSPTRTGPAHPPCPESSSSRSWLSPSRLWDLEKPPLEIGGHGLLRGVR